MCKYFAAENNRSKKKHIATKELHRSKFTVDEKDTTRTVKEKDGTHYFTDQNNNTKKQFQRKFQLLLTLYFQHCV